MNSVLPITTIVSDPAIRNGQPVIAGTAVRVSDLATSAIFRNLNAEELAANFGLDMGQVYAALAWYFQNREQIDAQIRAEATHADQLLAELDAQHKVIRFE